jgi:hypothetical protein
MQTTLKVLSDKSIRYMNYDLNGICETADSIYWTLVPKEVLAIWNIPYLVRLHNGDTVVQDQNVMLCKMSNCVE